MKTSALFLLVTVFIMSLGSGFLGGSLLWHLTRKYYYFWVTEFGVEMASSVMLIAGSLLCVPCSLLSFVVVHRPKPLTYMTLMILLSCGIFLFATGLMTSMNLSRSINSPALKDGMSKALKTSAEDPRPHTWFGVMQSELKCCGVFSYTEWLQYKRSLPPSCCGMNWPSNPWRSCPESQIHRQGCLKLATADLVEFVATSVTYASGLIITMAVALFVVAYMAITESEEESRKLTQGVVVAQPHAQVYQVTPPAPFYHAQLPPPLL